MNRLAAAALAALISSGPAPPGAAFGAEILTFASLDGDQKFALSGALVMPERAPGRAPAVVIVHATGGVDGTGAFYRGALNAARSTRRASRPSKSISRPDSLRRRPITVSTGPGTP